MLGNIYGIGVGAAEGMSVCNHNILVNYNIVKHCTLADFCVLHNDTALNLGTLAYVNTLGEYGIFNLAVNNTALGYKRTLYLAGKSVAAGSIVPYLGVYGSACVKKLVANGLLHQLHIFFVVVLYRVHKREVT